MHQLPCKSLVFLVQELSMVVDSLVDRTYADLGFSLRNALTQRDPQQTYLLLG